MKRSERPRPVGSARSNRRPWPARACSC